MSIFRKFRFWNPGSAMRALRVIVDETELDIIGLFSGSSRPKLPVAGHIEPNCRTVIQAPDLRGRIMRYEITDEEWTAIKRVERFFN